MSSAPKTSNRATEQAVELLEELCAISSASGDAEGLERCANRLGHELEELGLGVRLENRQNIAGEPQPVLVAGSVPPDGGHLLMIGHLDTVLPAVPPRLGDGRLEGTGALDMKGGFAALLGALWLRRSIGRALPRDLVVVAVPDEEIGGPTSEVATRTWGHGAQTVLVLEPGQATADGETIVTGRRGLSVWRLDARGRAAHSPPGGPLRSRRSRRPAVAPSSTSGGSSAATASSFRISARSTGSWAPATGSTSSPTGVSRRARPAT
jgi:glutamate carboxypeptidase